MRRLLLMGGLLLALGLIATAVMGAIAWSRRHETVLDDPRTEPARVPLTGQRLVAEIGERTSGRLLKASTLEVTAIDDAQVSLVYARSSPSPRMSDAEAEVAAVGVVKLAIDVLLAHGWNPRERRTSIFAHVRQQAGKSVTGADQVRSIGKAVYDYSADRVRFERE